MNFQKGHDNVIITLPSHYGFKYHLKTIRGQRPRWSSGMITGIAGDRPSIVNDFCLQRWGLASFRAGGARFLRTFFSEVLNKVFDAGYEQSRALVSVQVREEVGSKRKQVNVSLGRRGASNGVGIRGRRSRRRFLLLSRKADGELGGDLHSRLGGAGRGRRWKGFEGLVETRAADKLEQCLLEGFGFRAFKSDSSSVERKWREFVEIEGKGHLLESSKAVSVC